MTIIHRTADAVFPFPTHRNHAFVIGRRNYARIVTGMLEREHNDVCVSEEPEEACCVHTLISKYGETPCSTALTFPAVNLSSQSA